MSSVCYASLTVTVGWTVRGLIVRRCLVTIVHENS
jgi:hypothetical protein